MANLFVLFGLLLFSAAPLCLAQPGAACNADLTLGNIEGQRVLIETLGTGSDQAYNAYRRHVVPATTQITYNNERGDTLDITYDNRTIWDQSAGLIDVTVPVWDGTTIVGVVTAKRYVRNSHMTIRGACNGEVTWSLTSHYCWAGEQTVPMYPVNLSKIPTANLAKVTLQLPRASDVPIATLELNEHQCSCREVRGTGQFAENNRLISADGVVPPFPQTCGQPLGPFN